MQTKGLKDTDIINKYIIYSVPLCRICVGMMYACMCISSYCMLCDELLEPSELSGTSDSWLYVGGVEQYAKACRS
jgi:hypothetical protein